MPWIKLFETLVNGLFIPDNCRRKLPPLKRNVETIYLFKFIFKFVDESYILLHLRQTI